METSTIGSKNKATNGYVIAAIVIIVLIIIVLIGIAIWYLLRQQTVNPPPSPPFVPVPPNNPTFSDETGASNNGVVLLNNGNAFNDAVSCNRGATRRWELTPNANPQCVCVAPFYGSTCSLESFSDQYYAAGNIVNDRIRLNEIRTENVDRLSFPKSSVSTAQTTCTDLCNRDSSCVAVKYNQSNQPDFDNGATCTLLRNVTVIDDTPIVYNNTMQSDLYFKKGDAPTFEDRVFVYTGQLPVRYWATNRIVTSSGSSWALFENILYNIPFRPTSITNNRRFIGIMSNQTIDVNNARSLISDNSSNIIIIRPNESNIAIPSSWTTIYAVFIKDSSCGTNVDTNNQMGFKWNEGFSDRSGKKIRIKQGTSILFMSDDGKMHDMYETTENWYPMRQIEGESRELSVALTFNRTTYLRCNKHPNNMRLMVEVVECQDYTVEWNIGSKCNDTMEIRLGQTVRFSSTDGMYHGLVCSNSPENFNVPLSQRFNYVFQPKYRGRYNFHCRIYSKKLKTTIIVL